MKVIVTGTLGYDYIMDFPGLFADRIMPDRIHSLSLSFLVDKLNKQFGGTAGNIAYSLKLLGVNPALLSVAGNDFAPYNKFLLQKHVSTANVAVRRDVPTSSYFVITDKSHNQIGSFFVGATGYAKDLPLTKIMTKSDLVVISPTDPKAMVKYVDECQKAGVSYLYDPAFQIATFSAEELKKGIGGAKMLIGNDYEIALIAEKTGLSHEELIMMVPIVITTLGAKGSIIETRNDSIGIKPVKQVKVVDPTGAGDAYRSGFLAGYVRGYDLLTCGQMGSVAAAYTVELYGTVTHDYTKKEFCRRYLENYGQKLIL
jgi:adenosine kinase